MSNLFLSVLTDLGFEFDFGIENLFLFYKNLFSSSKCVFFKEQLYVLQSSLIDNNFVFLQKGFKNL